tara:strand:+ start:5470 stop:5664 length:195 start_codon:yes stop_codon:yes gene_type:complete
MTFEQYADSQGVKPTDPDMDIIHCAVEHYGEINTRLPAYKLGLWYDMANAYATGVLITFRRSLL